MNKKEQATNWATNTLISQHMAIELRHEESTPRTPTQKDLRELDKETFIDKYYVQPYFFIARSGPDKIDYWCEKELYGRKSQLKPLTRRFYPRILEAESKAWNKRQYHIVCSQMTREVLEEIFKLNEVVS